ncbi:MAG: hypothetical protein Q8O67_08125 [Deltaproteobacteria bacterium]|nr:hypothetical protein [Deltaproteobacteria bacterium]
MLLLLTADPAPAPAPAPVPAVVTPPPTTTTAPPLQAAEEALRAGIHKRCIELATQALQTGQLDVDGVARAWWTRARCHSIDGDSDRAQRSYAVAVRVKPGILMPVDDAAFTRVKAEGTAPATALVLEARAIVVDDIVAVELSAHDDLGLGRAFSLVDKDDNEIARSPLEPPAAGTAEAAADAPPTHRHRFSGIPVEGLRARLLDKHGNRLREADVVVDDAARNALIAAGGTPQTPAATAVPVTWLSYVGAGTAVVGLVAAASSGITLAITTQADETHVIDTELPWLVGFAGGVVVVVVGGALIVADQTATPEPVVAAR